MADTDSKLKIAELDFDTIKSNLKAFLKGQSEFSDYNFEGSGLSVLLDVLAYNTHYMGYYMNMVANEMFIDTSLLRSSVVSHAKLLGYTPKSRVSSKAIVDVSFSGVVTSSLTLPRFSRFIAAEKDGKSYIFVNTEQKVISQNSTGGFQFLDLEIKEGQPQGYSFTYDSQTNSKQLFELPDVGIDTSTLQVQVQNSLQDTTKTTFILAEDATEVDETSTVYYIEENRNGKYQIYFGDNIIGRGLSEGNIVIVSYLVSSGSFPNEISTFKLVDDQGYTATTTTVSESASGAEEESIDKIKLVAPKSFISQNRAVTKNDYINIINKKYPYFSAVTVWGGEENDPPVYGKVFFSVKPISNYQVTAAEIDYVANKVIKPYSVVTVKPEYVAPDYNYINLEVDVKYNPTKTAKTEGEIKTAVRDAILTYAQNNLNSFDITYKNSKVMREIDNSDPSIDDNEVNIVLEKRFRPTVNKSKEYTINFGIPLRQGNAIKKVTSPTAFKYFDSNGILRDAFLEEILQSYTGINSVIVETSGSNYTETPTLTIDGDGTGAVLEAVVVNGKISKVNVINQGIDYTSAIITVSGGGNGSGASLKADLQAKKGTLRIYYFDSNGAKKIINNDAGTVYYDGGYISLVSFNPNLISDAYGTMVIKAYPKNTILSATKNKVLALDTTDPNSIIINVSAINV
jgi:hypothetical protein